jgi:hypothetical protein
MGRVLSVYTNACLLPTQQMFMYWVSVTNPEAYNHKFLLPEENEGRMANLHRHFTTHKLLSHVLVQVILPKE